MARMTVEERPTATGHAPSARAPNTSRTRMRGVHIASWGVLWAALATASAGCSDDCEKLACRSDSLSVLLEPEDALIGGLEAGPAGDQIQDGWSVHFDKYLLNIGQVEVRPSTDPSQAVRAEEAFVVDLTKLAAQGEPLWTFDGLNPGRWEFHYATLPADAASGRHASVDAADFEAMTAAGATYGVDATQRREGGYSCPPAHRAMTGDAEPLELTNERGEPCFSNPEVRYRWEVPVRARFGPCGIDDVPGFAIGEGGASTVAATIHGDHLYFNGFPEGAEGGVTRRAQWIADADLDLDGEVTRAELEALAPSDMAEIDERYTLGGAPIGIFTLWDYVTAQLMTQGHFQGEGECPLDGGAP